MLEKNKDYIEMRVSSTDCAFTQNAATQISVDGYVYTTYMNLPDPGELYILVSKEKFDQLQTENEQLKKKLAVPDPLPEFRELLEKLYSKDDAENLEWTLNHICGGRDSSNGWISISLFWKRKYKALSRIVGFSSTEEIQDYLTNEAECDTLQEAILKLIKENKYTCEKWASANSSNNSWKNVTGYSAPEDYMHARISGAFRTPFDYTAAWQKATGCDSPCDAEKRIKALNERIDESEACYNHLLALTGFGSEGEIEDALDQCDHSTLRKALVDYEFDYEELLKLTGYKSNQDIRVELNHGEQFVYENMRELINSLKRKAKFTESNWQDATGRISPEAAKQYIDRLKGRLNKIHGYSVDW
jgi:hypothetical protein